MLWILFRSHVAAIRGRIRGGSQLRVVKLAAGGPTLVVYARRGGRIDAAARWHGEGLTGTHRRR